eukprot:scaffold153998_cov28-Tisochrysis_lutea.AAC.3
MLSSSQHDGGYPVSSPQNCRPLDEHLINPSRQRREPRSGCGRGAARGHEKMTYRHTRTGTWVKNCAGNMSEATLHTRHESWPPSLPIGDTMI